MLIDASFFSQLIRVIRYDSLALFVKPEITEIELTQTKPTIWILAGEYTCEKT